MAIVGECIALWTEVELQAAIVLAVMLKADAQPAAALYFSLSNERAKRHAMTAIAEHVLPDPERQIFDAWLGLKKSIEKERVDLAHGLLGITDADKEGIVWVSTQHRVRSIIDSMQYQKRPELLRIPQDDPAKNLFLYTIDDLDKLKSDITSLHEISRNVLAYIASVDPSSKDQLYQRLCQSPLLAKFLSQTSSNPKSGPSKPGPSPSSPDRSVPD